MSTHSYVRAGGVWATGTVVLSGELAALDFGQFDSISASGGTYAPAAIIRIGGAGVSIQIKDVDSAVASGAALTSHGTFTFASDSTTNFNGPVGYNGATTFGGFASAAFWGGSSANFYASSSLQLDGNVNSSTGVFLFGSGVSFTHNGPFYFGGSGTFAGADTEFSGALVQFNGAQTNLAGPTNLQGHTTLSNDLIVTGSGGIVERVVIGTNTNSTYSASSADLVYIPAGSITGSLTYYLDEAGAINGKKIRFHRADRGNSTTPILLRRLSDNSVLCELSWQQTGYIWTDVVRIQGVWQIVGGSIG